jgi:hypothetical protein
MGSVWAADAPDSTLASGRSTARASQLPTPRAGFGADVLRRSDASEGSYGIGIGSDIGSEPSWGSGKHNRATPAWPTATASRGSSAHVHIERIYSLSSVSASSAGSSERSGGMPRKSDPNVGLSGAGSAPRAARVRSHAGEMGGSGRASRPFSAGAPSGAVLTKAMHVLAVAVAPAHEGDSGVRTSSSAARGRVVGR